MFAQRILVNECNRLIGRVIQSSTQTAEARKRFEARTGLNARMGNRRVRPQQWEASDEFNPFIVKKHSRGIAERIRRQVPNRQYRPHPLLTVMIPKPGSTERRPISMSSVCDGAVAKYYYNRILDRNESRLSPYSYAYRQSVGVQDAIERVRRLFYSSSRVYAVEFDFSKYFDTIRHDYVLSVLDRFFRVTRTERYVISQFLNARRAVGVEDYRSGNFRAVPHGIPQGNCLSLLLANVACHELDMDLARLGLAYARFADDVLILAPNEGMAGNAFEAIVNHCERTGLSINFSKSDGIRVLSPQALGEPENALRKSSIDYLGHSFSYRLVGRRGNPARCLVRRIGVRERSLRKIRINISRIIYQHLLERLVRPPRRLRRSRVDSTLGVDWDLVRCINEIRRFVYGGIHERHISNALRSREVRLHRMIATMGFFPFVNDVEQLRQLDGWLLDSISKAVSSRERILVERNLVNPYPSLSKSQLLRADWYELARSSGVLPETEVRLPSFVRAWKYARKGLLAFSLRDFPSSSAWQY